MKIPQTAASSSRTTSRSAPGPRSIAAASGTLRHRKATKIDNLWNQLRRHWPALRRRCPVGLSGSVTLEDFAMLGGSVGLAPHVTVGKGHGSRRVGCHERHSTAANLGRLSGETEMQDAAAGRVARLPHPATRPRLRQRPMRVDEAPARNRPARRHGPDRRPCRMRMRLGILSVP